MTKTVNWKLVAATSDESEAHLLKNRLESEGIACRLETTATYPWTTPGGRSREWRVSVPLGDFERSQEILEEDLADQDEA